MLPHRYGSIERATGSYMRVHVDHCGTGRNKLPSEKILVFLILQTSGTQSNEWQKTGKHTPILSGVQAVNLVFDRRRSVNCLRETTFARYYCYYCLCCHHHISVTFWNYDLDFVDIHFNIAVSPIFRPPKWFLRLKLCKQKSTFLFSFLVYKLQEYQIRTILF